MHVLRSGYHTLAPNCPGVMHLGMCKLGLQKVPETTALDIVEQGGAGKGLGATSNDKTAGQQQPCTRSCTAQSRTDLAAHGTARRPCKRSMNDCCAKICGHGNECRVFAATGCVTCTALCGYSNYSYNKKHLCIASRLIQQLQRPDPRSQHCADH